MRRAVVILVACTSLFGAFVAAQDREPAGAFAPLPGRRLWYVDTGGTGTPVVLLHAASGSILMWERQLPALRAAGYRVIAFDRVGWGRSELDDGAAPGTAADDLQGLLALLRVERFHLVGTAAGGFVAFDYALSFPDRLRSLTVANSIGGVQDPEYQAAMQRLRTPDFLAMSPDMRELGPAYRVSNPEGAERWRALERTARPTSAQPTAQTFRNRVTFALLETITVPTLLLTGDADMYAPPPIMRMFAAHVKGSQAVVIPEAGHSGYWEQPEIFNRTVLDFITKH